MNKDQYRAYHRSMCDKMIEITLQKNSDYTGDTQDPFANFRLCESVNVCSTMQGFLTRMLDKIARINSFAQLGVYKVKSESVEDTLLDLANYCILMSGFIKSETDKDFLDKLPEWGSPNKVTEEEFEIVVKTP